MGDKSGMVVHHLAVMKPECMIYYVKMENRVYFVPDTFDQAEKKDLSHVVIALVNQPKLQMEILEMSGVIS